MFISGGKVAGVLLNELVIPLADPQNYLWLLVKGSCPFRHVELIYLGKGASELLTNGGHNRSRFWIIEFGKQNGTDYEYCSFVVRCKKVAFVHFRRDPISWWNLFFLFFFCRVTPSVNFPHKLVSVNWFPFRLFNNELHFKVFFGCSN